LGSTNPCAATNLSSQGQRSKVKATFIKPVEQAKIHRYVKLNQKRTSSFQVTGKFLIKNIKIAQRNKDKDQGQRSPKSNHITHIRDKSSYVNFFRVDK